MERANISDHILVPRVLTGDLKAFQELIEKYQKLVSHVVFRMVTRPADQEELCHEIFIKVYQNLSSFRFRCKLSTWIGKIAYNSCINYLKKRKIPLYEDYARLRVSSGMDDGIFDPWNHISEGVLEKSSRPDQIFEESELVKFLQRTIDQLPSLYRTIVTLFHVDEMNIKEIAEIMNLPEGTIKSYLFRGRKLLKDSILKIYQPEEILS